MRAWFRPEASTTGRKLPWQRPLLFIALVSVGVLAPFLVLGEDWAGKLTVSAGAGKAMVAWVTLSLLVADAVLPVPSSLVIVFASAKLGPLAAAGLAWAGLTGGVFLAAWAGRHAGAPVASALIPRAQREQLQRAAHTNAAVMLAGLRGVPVLAETSVVVAAAIGVPMRAIIRATMWPNLIIAVAFSIAAEQGPGAVLAAIGLALVVSALTWRRLIRSDRLSR